MLWLYCFSFVKSLVEKHWSRCLFWSHTPDAINHDKNTNLLTRDAITASVKKSSRVDMSDRVDLNHFTSRKTTLPWSFHLNLLTSVEQLEARMKDYGESWKMCLFVCSDSEVNKLSEEFSKEWIYNKCIRSIRNCPYEKKHLIIF